MTNTQGAREQLAAIEESLRKQAALPDHSISLSEHAAFALKITACLKGALHDLDAILVANDQLADSCRVASRESRTYERVLLKIAGDTVRGVSEAKELARSALVDAVIERNLPTDSK